MIQGSRMSLVLTLGGLVVAAFVLQRIYRRALNQERSFYMRDLSLLAGWALFALWCGDGPVRSVVAAAMMGAVVGMIQHTSPDRNLSWAVGLVGILFASMGPRISFIGLPGGEYLYLSQYQSFLATALWVTVFPLLFQNLDGIPGLAGHLLGVSFSLALLISSISGQSAGDGFVMSLAGLAFTAVFWSRLGHNYRKLGKPLAAFWGILVAGTSLISVTKGVTFTALMVIPMGLYALPLAEVSINIVSQAIPIRKFGRVSIYHRLMDKGMDHPKAVKFVTFLCLAIGSSVSFVQLGIDEVTRPIWLSILGVSFFAGIWCLRDSKPALRNSRLWGVSIDGISMNYALSKVRARLLNEEPSGMVVTANSLSLYKAKKDPVYRHTADKAWLTLPDGAGLVWAMKLLGMPVVERVPGIDFMMGLCRLGASEKWPVYLFGGKPGVAEEAASKLQELYPGLVVAGCKDGYSGFGSAVVEDIKNSGARILFTALGMPKQDFWLQDNLPKLGAVIGVGVGGAFDVLSGRLKRAPELWRKFGLEWLYRLIQEPWRLRQDLDLVLFVFAVLMEKLGLIRREV